MQVSDDSVEFLEYGSYVALVFCHTITFDLTRSAVPVLFHVPNICGCCRGTGRVLALGQAIPVLRYRRMMDNGFLQS